ncbi:MAG: putative sugar O-methyltransferase [Armatimonadetes bacterium]|nr:putative sugar O-methyltransferase [Armatimonadota bacterium]
MSVRNALQKASNRRILQLRGRCHRIFRKPDNQQNVQTYDLMKQDNKNAPELYQAGRFWEQINRRYSELIWGGGLEDLRTQYFNRTFAGPEPESRQVYRSLLHVYSQIIRPLDTEGFLDRESEPPEGGTADQEVFNGRAWSLDFLQSIEEAYRIRFAWQLANQKGTPRLIVELGAGYGRLAYVCHRMFPDCTYVILDLPEALACSSSWLSRVIPGGVVPYTGSRRQKVFTRDELLTRKVWTLGAHQIEGIAEGSVDAFINIYSFAEMPQESINNYFDHIDRLTRGILYSKQRKLEQNREDQVKIGMDDYPYRKDWRQLFLNTTFLYDDFFECAYSVHAH